MLSKKLKHFFSGPFITLDKISNGVKQAEYAVRGTIPMKAAQIAEQIRLGQGVSLPFDSLTELNIGNPHLFGQKPISFNREVLSCVMNPNNLEKMPFSNDIKKRAKYYIQNIPGNSIGAYSESIGYRFVRENVSKFLQKRDGGNETNISHIILTDGASNGIHLVLNTILTSKDEGIMIPIPQYPLYSALIGLNQIHEVPYYLNEDRGWQIDLPDLEKSVSYAKERNIKIKAMVVINPGNPTGQILNEETIRGIIKFSYNNKIAIIADEVYQENIYKKNAKFISFRNVIQKIEPPYNTVDLFSFHSTSKGLLGECGVRGGFIKLTNIQTEVVSQIVKLKSIYLCSNTSGQIMTDLMVNPPTREDCTEETVEHYLKQKEELQKDFTRRAQIITEELNKMKNVKCNEVEGAMYAFPRIFFTQKIIDEAKKRNMAPDLFYTYEALHKTGIVLVPGSGFRQQQGTHHFRTTILITPEEKLIHKMKELSKFNDWFFNEHSK